MSAVVLRRALERAPIGVRPFAILAAIAATPDLPPIFLRRAEEKVFLERFVEEEAELLAKPEEEPLRLELEMFLATLKTAAVLEAWIDEQPIVELTDRFGIGAGDLRAKVEDADWLLFGASRLAQHFQRRAARTVDDLSLRVRYGVREELLDLVRLKGIGRVRSRLLYNAGLTDREALRSAPLPRVEAVLRSRKLAESVLSQVASPRARPNPEPPAQASPPPPAPHPGRTKPTSPGRRLEDFPT